MLLADILCIQEERVVGNDNTVSYDRRRLQIPPSPIRPHYVRAKVRVHHYPDGSYGLFHGPRCLARYDPDGCLEAEPLASGVNRFDAAQACGLDGQRRRVAHNPTGPTTTTEAVNRCATKTGQLDVLSTLSVLVPLIPAPQDAATFIAIRSVSDRATPD